MKDLTLKVRKQTSSAGGHYDTVAEFFVQFLQMQIYKVLVFLLEN